jgi:hypothetical protein
MTSHCRMRYSLLSRFRGGILGSCLGDHLFRKQPGLIGEVQTSPWQEVAIAGYDSLRECKTLNWEDWQGRIIRFDPLARPPFEPEQLTAGFAIAMLPLILFFHDNVALLKQHLTQLSETWLSNQVNRDELFFWVDLITLVIKDKPLPDQIFTGDCPGKLGQEVAKIRKYSQKFTPIDQVTAKIRHPFAQVLYCFSSSPDQFSISLLRSRQIGHPNVMLLAGALSGLYNTESGISLDWRFRYAQQPDRYDSDRLADQLFSAWSGMYHPSESGVDLGQIAIAPPGLIQSRPSLRIISQQE